jgi:hypothetical protein
MKKIIFTVMAITTLLLSTGCEKDENAAEGGDCNLPATAAPAGLAGNWANGFTSMTKLIDVYNGQWVGNTWQSGKFFKITGNGNNAEFYYMAQSQYSQTATKATGTIAFDAGSAASEGSFTFYPCWAHYKGWGNIVVDRDATPSELTNNLTVKYFYRMEGRWLRIQPNGPVNDYSSSFEIVN